jgi:hypothetical protein
MNKVVGLLLLVGLVAAAYVNRDKIAALRGEPKQEEVATSEPTPEPAQPNATPHPARESQALATRLYPGLNNPGSGFNKKFLALHSEAQRNNPELLTRPDWPITLADRTMVALGGSPVARSTPVPITPKPLTGTVMDQKGPSHSPK